MTNMYNVIFESDQQEQDYLLSLIGLERGHFGRFRDIFVDKDSNIVAYARIGGPNQSAYQYIYDELETNPHYLSNNWDRYDSTYALFFFNGKIFEDQLKNLTRKPYPEERWKDFASKL